MNLPHDPTRLRLRILADLPAEDPRLMARGEGPMAWFRLGEVPVGLAAAARQIPGLARPSGEAAAASEALARLRRSGASPQGVMQVHRLGDAEAPGMEGRVAALRACALRPEIPACGGGLRAGSAWDALLQTHAFALGFGQPCEGDVAPLEEEGLEAGEAPADLQPSATPAPMGERDLEPALRRWAASPDFADPAALCGPMPSGRAALFEVPGRRTALALAHADASRGGNGDPFWAAAHAVASAARKVACVGAEPAALMVALAMGPEGPEQAWALQQSVAGLRQACLGLELSVAALEAEPCPAEALGAPLVAPVVAVVGLIEDHAGAVDVAAPEAKGLTAPGNRSCGLAWRGPFEGLFLLGELQESLEGAWMAGAHGALPELRLDAELRLQQALREGIGLGLIRSARDLEAGGLMGAVADAGLAAGMGAQLLLSGQDPAAVLFGEAPGRVLVSAGVEGESALRTLCATHRVPLLKVGMAGGRRFSVAFNGTPLLDVEGEEIRTLRAAALAPWLGS